MNRQVHKKIQSRVYPTKVIFIADGEKEHEPQTIVTKETGNITRAFKDIEIR